MKKIIVLCLLILGLLCLTNYVYADLNNGLVAYYPFNGSANDQSPNEHDGTVVGAELTSDRNGIENSAYMFYGADEKVYVTDTPALRIGADAFSIVAWINTTQYGPWKRIVTKRMESMTSSGNWISLAAHYGKARFEIYAQKQIDSVTDVNDGMWHCLVVTRNVEEGTIYLYVDGNLESAMADDGRDLSNQVNMEIGVWSNESYYYESFSGAIDDIRIYNRALSESEVLELYNDSGGETDPEASDEIELPDGINLVNKTDNPMDAPITLGDVVTGGYRMEPRVNFPAYNEPVDIWVVIGLPDGRFHVIDDSGNIISLDEMGFVPVAKGVSERSTVLNGLPSFEVGSQGSPFEPWPEDGVWEVYWLVAPSNGGDIMAALENGKYELGFYQFSVSSYKEYAVLVSPSTEDQTLGGDGVYVTIPANTLETEAELSIRTLNNPPEHDFPALQLQSMVDIQLGDMTVFTRPLTIRFPYNPELLQDNISPERNIQVAYYDNAGVWNFVDFSLDPDKNEIVVETNHLTKWGWLVWAAGYKVVETELFTVAYDEEDFKPTVNESGIPMEAIEPNYYKLGDNSNWVDPEINDYVEDVVAYLNYAFHRYKSKGYKVPDTPINVWVGKGHNSRSKFTGGILIGLNSMSQNDLKLATAHEIFHSFQSAYMYDVFLGSPLPIFNWGLWYIEASAEYAAEYEVWDGTLGRMGKGNKPLSHKFLEYAIDSLEGHDNGYHTAHFIKYLVDQGIDFKALSEYLFTYTMTEMNSYLYPLNEYLVATLGGTAHLGEQYSNFARYFVFDANSPMPEIKDSLSSQATSYTSTIPDANEVRNYNFDLKKDYSAKLYGFRLDEIFEIEKTNKLTLTISDAGISPKSVVDVVILTDDQRQPGGTPPAGSLYNGSDPVKVELNKGDALYVLSINTSSKDITNKIDIRISPEEGDLKPVMIDFSVTNLQRVDCGYRNDCEGFIEDFWASGCDTYNNGEGCANITNYEQNFGDDLGTGVNIRTVTNIDPSSNQTIAVGAVLVFNTKSCFPENIDETNYCKQWEYSHGGWSSHKIGTISFINDNGKPTANTTYYYDTGWQNRLMYNDEYKGTVRIEITSSVPFNVMLDTVFGGTHILEMGYTIP